MIKFIKKLFKTNINKEDNKEYQKEYKKVPEPKEIEPKVKYLDEALDRYYRSNMIVEGIISLISGSIRPNQEHCSPLLIREFEQLFACGIEEDINKAVHFVHLYLPEQLSVDLFNNVKHSKEYKEYKIRKRIEEISKDFN